MRLRIIANCVNPLSLHFTARIPTLSHLQPVNVPMPNLAVSAVSRICNKHSADWTDHVTGLCMNTQHSAGNSCTFCRFVTVSSLLMFWVRLCLSD